MIANIALDDGLILPHSANLTGPNFRERQVGWAHLHLLTVGQVDGRVEKAGMNVRLWQIGDIVDRLRRRRAPASIVGA